MGELDAPRCDVTANAKSVEDEQAAAAIAARPQPHPSLDLLARVLQGLILQRQLRKWVAAAFVVAEAGLVLSSAAEA
ncbi:hypothetical protein, partial [Amycolatopsis marina]|uniref:hypothetical protein n=1 Tax=Amycolatopsis marina TaxID=490629 RepID=UPI001C42F3B8